MPISSAVYKRARWPKLAEFFEEGLETFLNLDWGIKVNENLALKFIKSYDVESRTIDVGTDKIQITG